jgi:hypothetical protein
MSIPCFRFVAPSSFQLSFLPVKSSSSLFVDHSVSLGVIELGEALEILFFSYSFYDVPGSLLNVLTFNI